MSANALADKTVIVTGGAGGLGKAIVTASLEAGANAVIADINQKLLEQCKSEFGANPSVLVVQVDVTDGYDAERLFSEAIEKFGRVNALVNNAGIIDNFAPVGDIDMASFDRVMSINLKGPVILSKIAVNHFLEQEEPSGNIVNIGSQSSFRGGTAGLSYTASKHALKGVTLNTAAAYSSKNIRCNLIMPGSMHTNITDSFKAGINMEGFAMMEKTRAVNTSLVDINSVGKTAVHLMSDFAIGINGACITADGGWSAF